MRAGELKCMAVMNEVFGRIAEFNGFFLHCIGGTTSVWEDRCVPVRLVDRLGFSIEELVLAQSVRELNLVCR